MIIVLGKVFVEGHRLGYEFAGRVFFSLSYMDPRVHQDSSFTVFSSHLTVKCFLRKSICISRAGFVKVELFLFVMEHLL